MQDDHNKNISPIKHDQISSKSKLKWLQQYLEHEIIQCSVKMRDDGALWGIRKNAFEDILKIVKKFNE